MVSLWLEPPHCPEALVRRCMQATPLRGVDGHFDFVPPMPQPEALGPNVALRCNQKHEPDARLSRDGRLEQVALFP